jgi:uncharacterized protein YraI
MMGANSTKHLQLVCQVEIKEYSTSIWNNIRYVTRMYGTTNTNKSYLHVFIDIAVGGGRQATCSTERLGEASTGTREERLGKERDRGASGAVNVL